MSRDPQDPRDDRLAAALRETLGTGRAPEAWVREALEIPRRVGSPRGRPRIAARPIRPAGVPVALEREPWLAVLFPHLAGLGLLIGLALVWILRPELLRTALEPAVLALRGMSFDPSQGFWTLAGLLAPLVVLLIDQGARGFPVLRRLHLTH